MQIKKHKVLFLSDTPFIYNNSLTWWRWILKLGVEKSSRDDRLWGPDTNQPEYESIFKERFKGNKKDPMGPLDLKERKQTRERSRKFVRDVRDKREV